VAVLALGSGIGILACGEDLDVLAIVNYEKLTVRKVVEISVSVVSCHVFFFFLIIFFFRT